MAVENDAERIAQVMVEIGHRLYLVTDLPLPDMCGHQRQPRDNPGQQTRYKAVLKLKLVARSALVQHHSYERILACSRCEQSDAGSHGNATAARDDELVEARQK